MVEYEGFGQKRMKKGEGQGGRLNMRTAILTAILSHGGMEESRFLLTCA